MLADLRFGVARAGEPVAWLDSVGNRRLVRRPGIIELQWQLPEIQLDAVLELTVPAGLPALVARIRVNAREPVDVVAAWEATHGPGWLEDGLTEPLLLGRQPRSGAAVWRDRRSEFHALAGFSRQIDRAVVGYQPWRHLGPGGLREPGRSRLADDALGSASVALQTHHAPGQPALAFVVAGDRAPLSEVEEAWAALLAEPAAAFTAPSDGSPNAAPRSQLEIGTDRPQVNEALRWLLSGFRALQAEPPDVESPVLAAAHRSGGSDLGSGALWGVLAANDLGDHGLAAATLRHLARHRWPDGTIPGRLEPLGPSHASPQIGTPLFVLAAADTVRVTDDAVLADDLWPAVVGALAACRRSDRDGDGLMDHLGTPPPPLDTVEDLVAEVSLAGLHAAAVAAAARLARARDDGVTAARLEAEALTLRDALNDGFWNGPARYHVLGRSDEGPLLLRTVFPALPLALGMLNPGEGSALLEPLASAAMTTDWGVAWLDRTHPDPGNPLSGPVEVHPLHTAWTTLAEYRAHRATPAWGHLATQLELLMAAGGRLPRRLRVDRLEEMGEPAESLGGYALSIVALVRGTLGIRSDARQALLEIVPQLPADWGRVSIESLRIGPQVFRLALRQSDDLLLYEFDRVEGKETSSVELLLGARVPRDVAVDLDPEVTRGVELLAEPRVESSQSARIARVRVRPVASHFTVGFRQGLHPRVVVEPTIPAPGQASSGLRIHAPTFRDDSLSVPVEGLPGRSYLLRLATPWRVDGVGGVPGAIVSAPGPGRAEVRFQIPGTGEQHRRVELEMTFRR